MIAFNISLEDAMNKRVESSVYNKAYRELKDRVKSVLENYGFPAGTIEVEEYEEIEFDPIVRFQIRAGGILEHEKEKILAYAAALESIARLVEQFPYSGFEKYYKS